MSGMSDDKAGLLPEFFAYICAHPESDGSHSDELSPPGPPADLVEVEAAERALGVIFDDEYRAMLLSADGWPNMQGMYRIFGVADYLRLPRDTGGHISDTIVDEGAAAYFSSQEFNDPSESAIAESGGYRAILVGKSTVSSRFFIMRFSCVERRPRSPFFDCMSGGDDRYDGIAEWLNQQRQWISEGF